MLKHILVPTDGSEFASMGVTYAVAFAKHYDAVVHGLHVVDIKLLEGPFLRDISSSLGTAPYLNYQGNIALILEEKGKAALDAMQQRCEASSVQCEINQVTSTVPKAIIEKSLLCDLVILGRGGEHSKWLDGLLGSTTEVVARRATRPVLVTGTDTPGHRLFLMAYDGSHHSKSALQTAASMSADWRTPLHVLIVAAEQRAEALRRDAESYLNAHKLDVQYIVQHGDPAESIVSYAKCNGADLIIMGAYGQTRVLELVLGSTTAYTLNHAPCPVLLVR